MYFQTLELSHCALESRVVRREPVSGQHSGPGSWSESLGPADSLTLECRGEAGDLNDSQRPERLRGRSSCLPRACKTWPLTTQ